MDWWQLSTNDTLNDSIWSDSPAVQSEIQTVANATATGIGAQQAMLTADPLPWVPDLLGELWQEANSVLIVGSAYAPFIHGSAGRNRTMALSGYSRAESWKQFQSAFLQSVILGDRSYYEPLTAFAAATASPSNGSQVAVFDLCRVSFVERDSSGRFVGGDGVVKGHCALYERYVEHPRNQEWLWGRLTMSNAGRIVALGTIAEHGLLRLFARRGMALRIDGATRALPSCPSGSWVGRYAAQGRTLASWCDAGGWWTIRGSVEGRKHEWALLPVQHPSARGSRNAYAREIDLLNRMPH